MSEQQADPKPSDKVTNIATSMPAPTKITAETPPVSTTVIEAVAVPKTTAEEDRETAGKREAGILTAAGQRHINIIWERTQQVIAFVVVLTGMMTATFVIIQGMTDVSLKAEAAAAFVFISSTTSLVIGFYFGRSNHTRTGGVGNRDR